MLFKFQELKLQLHPPHVYFFLFHTNWKCKTYTTVLCLLFAILQHICSNRNTAKKPYKELKTKRKKTTTITNSKKKRLCICLHVHLIELAYRYMGVHVFIRFTNECTLIAVCSVLSCACLWMSMPLNIIYFPVNFILSVFATYSAFLCCVSI